MKPSWGKVRISAVAILSAAAFAIINVAMPIVSHAQPTPTPACSPGVTSTLINTGQGSGLVGDSDPHWCLISDPLGVPGGVTAPAAAIVVTSGSQLPPAQWVSASTTCRAPTGLCPAGYYTYQICWTQTGTGSVSLQFLSDNNGCVCPLNTSSCTNATLGAVCNSASIGNQLPATLFSSAGSLSGRNCLYIQVYNYAGTFRTGTPTGLDVQGYVCGNVTLLPPCATPRTGGLAVTKVVSPDSQKIGGTLSFPMTVTCTNSPNPTITFSLSVQGNSSLTARGESM
jgi:hypothetical protein